MAEFHSRYDAERVADMLNHQAAIIAAEADDE